MRKLSFSPYEEGDWRSPSFKRFGLLWASLQNPQWQLGGDKKVLRTLVTLLGKVEDVTVAERAKQGDTYKLRTDGPSLLLEGAEYDLVLEAWKALMPSIPRGNAKDALDYDIWLEDAENVEVAEVSKGS